MNKTKIPEIGENGDIPMQKSKIEWTDYTWNPITGCINGCPYCYARKMAENPYYKKAFPYGFKPHFYADRLKEIDKTKPSSKIFVCSMGELFGENEGWTNEVLVAIDHHPDLIFQLLTKQPQNLIKWSPFPENCWVGITVCDDKMANGIVSFEDIEATVKFVSYEPMLENAHLHYYIDIFDWLIIGSQTQPTCHPPKEWVDEIITAADKAKIPVFVKEPMASYYNIQRQEFPLTKNMVRIN